MDTTPQHAATTRARQAPQSWRLIRLVSALILVAAGCTSSDDPSSGADGDASDSVSTEQRGEGGELMAGAASASILATVDGARGFLSDAPGWPESGIDPFNPGVYVAKWDQGQVDVDNGSDDSAWAHDDLRSTAVAFQRGIDRVVMVSTDTYMHFAPDVDEIERRARALLPDDWSEVRVLVAATHNHHGPGTAFVVNDDWYDMMANQTAQAVADAVDSLAPAKVAVASGEHRYGVNDVRDPVILDPRLNVMAVDDADSGDPIATIVQWGSHPETTLGWEPPAEAADLDKVCGEKGWEGDDCSAEGRYLTADYPGVLQTRIKDQVGGELLYFNGAIGNQIGPGQAPTWIVDNDHPVTDDGQPPEGAQPLSTCDDPDPYLCRSFAKTESIGTELANAVIALRANAEPTEVTRLTVTRDEFKTRLTNIGFRVLLANGDLGWQEPTLYTCVGDPVDDVCTEAPADTEEDPVITPLAESEVVVGDVIPSRMTDVDMGPVGFMFLPGEVPPELVIGLPDDFTTNAAAYYRDPGNHAVGADYQIPGYLLSLVDYDTTFTVGLGTDELGYWVPVDEYRLKCVDLALPAGATCADLAERDVIESPDYIGGRTCVDITRDPSKLEALADDATAVQSICRYGQALGRELGEPEGHYEETNAAGWDLVDDLWASAQRLYGE